MKKKAPVDNLMSKNATICNNINKAIKHRA